MKVLILGAHTDDAEFAMGGTIKNHVDDGDEVTVVAFTNCGNPDLELEMDNAMEVLGVTNYISLDFTVRMFDSLRQRITNTIWDMKQHNDIDIIYTHSSTDIHQDHEVLHNAVKRVFKNDSVSILGWENPGNCNGFVSDYYENICEVNIWKKTDAINCYKSQFHRDIMSPVNVKSLAVVRGHEVGWKYAEGFEVIRLIKPQKSKSPCSQESSECHHSDYTE